MARVYATESDWLTYTGLDTAPEGLAGRLAVASRVVDVLLRGVPYATDDDGMPTDDEVKETMSLATCAQSLITPAARDGGQPAAWSSVEIASVQLSGGARSDAVQVGRLWVAVDCLTALEAGGLSTAVAEDRGLAWTFPTGS